MNFLFLQVDRDRPRVPSFLRTAAAGLAGFCRGFSLQVPRHDFVAHLRSASRAGADSVGFVIWSSKTLTSSRAGALPRRAFLLATVFAASVSGQPAPAPVPAPAPLTFPDAPPAPKVDEAAAVLAPVAGGLTSEGAARRTQANSHTVRARIAELDVARARLDQTTAQFLPRLTLRAAYVRLSPVSSGLGSGALVGAANPGLLGTGPCPNGVGQCVLDSQGQPVGAAEFEIESFEDTYALTASLNVPISDYVLRLSSATAGASANRRAAELQVKAERLKVAADAQALFYDWLRAKGRVAVAEKSLERTQARLRDARPSYELGAITKADLMRLESLAANTEQVLLEARAFRDLTQVQLAVLIGEKREGVMTVGEDVSVPLSPIKGELEALTREALAARTELKAMAEASRALRLASRAVKIGSYPRVDAFGDVTYANPNQRFFPQQREWQATWSVGVAATFTVGDVFLNGASSRELSATARALEEQRQALADGIRQEVAAHYLARQRADGALRTARRGLAASEEAYRVSTDLFRVGKGTTTELIESETDLLTSRLIEITARLEQRIAEVRLKHAVGRDIPR
jgi:outer membrane protein